MLITMTAAKVVLKARLFRLLRKRIIGVKKRLLE